jgi:hypothetical protein
LFNRRSRYQMITNNTSPNINTRLLLLNRPEYSSAQWWRQSLLRRNGALTKETEVLHRMTSLALDSLQTWDAGPLLNGMDTLPSNRRCLQSHYLARGLFATVYFSWIMENRKNTFVIFVQNNSFAFKKQNYFGIFDLSENVFKFDWLLYVKHAIDVHDCKKVWRTQHRHILLYLKRIRVIQNR